MVHRFLIEVFDEHNVRMEALLGNGFEPNTLKGYRTSVFHLKEYLLKDYIIKDIDIRNIDHGFITGYEFTAIMHVYTRLPICKCTRQIRY